MMLDSTLAPLAWTLAGTPVWPLLGADGEVDAGDDGDDADESEASDDGLTDAGRQAIARERAAAERAKSAYKPVRQLMRELGIPNAEALRERLTTQRAASGDEGDPVDVDAVRREVAAEVNTAANQRILRSEIRRIAAETFIDPRDALSRLDLTSYEVDEEGDVDVATIQKDLKTVLKESPHLGKRSKPASFDGGTRKPVEEPRKMSDVIRDAAAARRGLTTR